MKKLLLFLFLLTSIESQCQSKWQTLEGSDVRARYILLADIGNEPDEIQQIFHMLMYADQYEVKGLVAVMGKYLRGPKEPGRIRLYPELYEPLLEGYSTVYRNLRKHSPLFPSSDDLRKTVVCGQDGYGTKFVGEGMSTDGSELIIRTLREKDERPIVVVVNGGSNTLAQALLDFEKRYPKELSAAIAKLRVVENGAQDDAGALICNRYPDIYWIRSNRQAYGYGGPSKDGGDYEKGPRKLGPHTWKPYAYNATGQHQWALEYIIAESGRMGRQFPIRQHQSGAMGFIEGGGTIPFLCMINKGLTSLDNFDWGGWSGRYTSEKVENFWSRHSKIKGEERAYAPFKLYGECTDEWVDPEDGFKYKSLYAPVWRWRRAAMNDMRFRMDWCRGSVEKSNHNPVATIDGDASNTILIREVKEGETITLDGSKSSDPDGDALSFRWFHYQEVGGFDKEIKVADNSQSKTTITIPAGVKGKDIHIILELRDNADYNEAMFDYRRLILKVR